MKTPATLVVSIVFGLLFLSASAQAAEQKTSLMLGGEYCEYYLNDVAKALTAVKGVTGVDVKSKKGYAVVTHDDTVKDETLIATVGKVKGTKNGTEWYCDAMVMD
jgi:periplasmic mercuric ion binding protein